MLITIILLTRKISLLEHSYCLLCINRSSSLDVIQLQQIILSMRRTFTKGEITQHISNKMGSRNCKVGKKNA